METLQIELDVSINEVSSKLEELAELSANYMTKEEEVSLQDLDSLYKEFKAALKEARKKGEFYRATLVETEEDSNEEETQDEE